MNVAALAPWQSLLDGLQEAVWLIDARTCRVHLANAAASKLTQKPAGDFVGLHVLDIAATPQDAAFWSETAQVIANGIDSESVLLRQDGVLLAVNRRVVASNLPGFETLLLMSMVDRSAQHKGQRELEASLAQLRATLDSAADGMLVCGLDGNVHAFNQKFAHLWKMPLHLLGQRDDNAVHAFMAAGVTDPGAHAQRLRALTLMPEAPASDLIALLDGRTLERRSVPQIRQGRVTGRVFSFRDITEQLKWQADLRLAARVFEYSDDAIFIADSAFHLLQLNPAAQRLLGQSLQQLQGRQVLALLEPAGAVETSLSAEVQNAWLRDGVWRGEVSLPGSKDVCAMFLSWVAVRDADGKVDKSIGFLRDLTEQRATRKKTCELAYSDSLTGLPNRLLLAQRVESAVLGMGPEAVRFAVVCLDMDRFRVINDSLGHAFGDRVLQLVAARLQSSLRPEDLLSRLGGDEFVMYLHACSAEAAETVARRVLDEMRSPFTLDGIGFSIQCSMGVAMCPQHGHTLEQLIKQADTAMYRVKDQGGGSFGFYQPEMNANLLQRMQMEHALRQALEQGSMSVHYQPQVQTDSHRIVGAEALLRWTDPRLGSVTPANFIALAQETGYIVTLGAWVLEQSVQQAACWLRAGHPVAVSVNVSALEFRQPDFVQRLAQLLQLHGVPGELLELELTESVLLQDAQKAAERLAALAELRVALVIDDFGTGHSSLASLKKLSIRKLKVDRSFVRGLPEGDDDHAIVSAIVRMGHALGMDVVAKGVETHVQRQMLEDLGCDFFQGYLYAPALTPMAFGALLASEEALAVSRQTGEPSQPEVMPFQSI